MHTTMYKNLKQLIENRFYTVVQAQEVLNDFRAKLQITSEEYDELWELIKDLEVNTSDDQQNIRFTKIENDILTIKQEIQAIKDKLAESGTVVPEPEPTEDGTEFNPITAQAGMKYYKDKYYLDPSNNEVYLCIRDSDTEPGTGVELAYLPSQLVNIYFNWVRKASE